MSKLNNSIGGGINCSDHKEHFVEIFTSIPSFGVTAFGIFCLPIIIMLGTTGNIISLIILRRAAKIFSSHFYLWWMAIFDIISLLSDIPTFWAVIILRPYYFYIYGPEYPPTWVEYGLLNIYACKIRMFVTFTSRTCSIYTIVLVTFERFIMVLFPMKRIRLCTLNTAKISITIMVVTSVLLNLPWFFSFNMIRKPCIPIEICVGNSLLTINIMIEFIILCLLPCVIIIVCNCCIIITLRGRLHLNILVNTESQRKQERDITVRLLAVSFAFFILTIPSLVVISMRSVKELNHNTSFLRGPQADLFIISIILFAVNLAVNFIIYCLTGKNFRIAALALIKCNLKEMRKYRDYLIAETTSTESADRIHIVDKKEERCRNIELVNSSIKSKCLEEKILIKSNT